MQSLIAVAKSPIYVATELKHWHDTVTHCKTHRTRQHPAQILIDIAKGIMYAHTLLRAATHCNTLQHTAAHCSSLQHTAAHCSTLQGAPLILQRASSMRTRCNTLQHAATHCNTLQHTTTHYNPLRHYRCKKTSNVLRTSTATHCNTMPNTV